MRSTARATMSCAASSDMPIPRKKSVGTLSTQAVDLLPASTREATRVEAGEEIDRLVAQRAYDQVEGWMREMGMSEDAAHDMVARSCVFASDAGLAMDVPAQPPRGQGRRRLAHP